MTEERQTAPEEVGAIISALTDVAQGDVESVVIVTRKAKKAPELFHARVQDRVAAGLARLANRTSAEYKQRTLVEYVAARLVDSAELMWLPTKKAPYLQSLAETASDVTSLSPFEPRRLPRNGLKLIIVHLRMSFGIVTLYQHIRPSQVIGQTETGLNVVLRRGYLTEPTGLPMLQIQQHVTCVVAQGIAFFTKPSEFQQVFEFTEEMRQLADSTFTSLSAAIKIEGADDLRQMVLRNPIMMAKMVSIQRKLETFPSYRNALTMECLVQFVRSRDDCDVEVIGDGGEARLVYDSSPRNRYKLLRLLDDDFLKSELTSLDYEANSKGLPTVHPGDG